jgi:hypothetical protein
VSLTEWVVHYYHSYAELDNPPIKFVARAGELFVPSGWWHSVLNIDTTSDTASNTAAEGNCGRSEAVARSSS